MPSWSTTSYRPSVALLVPRLPEVEHERAPDLLGGRQGEGHVGLAGLLGTLYEHERPGDVPGGLPGTGRSPGTVHQLAQGTVRTLAGLPFGPLRRWRRRRRSGGPSSSSPTAPPRRPGGHRGRRGRASSTARAVAAMAKADARPPPTVHKSSGAPPLEGAVLADRPTAHTAGPTTIGWAKVSPPPLGSAITRHRRGSAGSPTRRSRARWSPAGQRVRDLDRLDADHPAGAHLVAGAWYWIRTRRRTCAPRTGCRASSDWHSWSRSRAGTGGDEPHEVGGTPVEPARM